VRPARHHDQTEATLLLIGWDWASTSHAVTIDTAGAIVSTWTLSHTQEELDTTLARLASYGDPPTCRWRSNAAMAWWSTGC
jgi:hypothetical protein